MMRWIAAFMAVLPVLANAAPGGEALFEEHCAVCHQTEGHGGIGLPLDKGRLSLVSDDYLTKTIRLGRPGRLMPAFSTLSDAQVLAIVGYLRGHYNAASHEYSAEPLGGDPARGEKLYAANCSGCHGLDGSGEGRGTGVSISRKRDFAVMPPAITNSGFLASAPDAMISAIIKQGRPGGVMPAFKKHLDDAQIADVVAHVRELGKTAAANQPPRERLELTFIVDSPYDFKTTVKNVRQALSGTNFRIFPDRFLEEGLTDEFSHNPKQISLRFCNFNQLFDLLNIEPRLGVVLPCRVTVVEHDDGSVQLIAANMRTIAHWFNNDELEEVAKQMAEAVETVLEEATI